MLASFTSRFFLFAIFFPKIEVLDRKIIENITERIIKLFIYPKYIFQ